jgi:autophagy-related protein 9
MYSNAQYHTLTEQAGDNDLWDELNDIESREAMQHQSRFQAASPYSRGNATIIIMSMAQSTAQRIHSAFTSAWRAAQEARNRYPRRSFYENNTDMDLDRDFGIADLRPTDFEERTTTQNSNRNPFVILSNFPRQAISSPSDSHGLVSNLDVTLKHLYDYFFSRGLLPIVSNFFVEATTLLFTLWLSRILIKNVDWEQLSTCKDEDSCLAKWSDYYRKEPLGWVHWFIIEGFNILFSCYFIFVSWNFWQSLQHALTSQHIMHEKLGISKRKLQGGSITWDAVVTKLIEAQDSGEYRLALGTLDELIIAQRIMRKENFLIAFWNQNLLDTKVGSRYYWCPSLEWCCYSCILNFMFNHKYELRPAFYLDSDSLQRRLKVCGIIHGLLLPFLVMFVLLHFFLSQVYDLKTSRQYMGNKCWSSVAMHTFREFNELPHVFRKRLEPSYEVAENYINLFGKSEVNAAIGRVLVFVGGAVGGILLLLGVLNDAILLHVQLWGRNLLWYAGIAGESYHLSCPLFVFNLKTKRILICYFI